MLNTDTTYLLIFKREQIKQTQQTLDIDPLLGKRTSIEPTLGWRFVFAEKRSV